VHHPAVRAVAGDDAGWCEAVSMAILKRILNYRQQQDEPKTPTTNMNA